MTDIAAELIQALAKARKFREAGMDEDAIHDALLPLVKTLIPPHEPREWPCARCGGTGWEPQICRHVGRVASCGRLHCRPGHSFVRYCECSKGRSLQAAHEKTRAAPDEDQVGTAKAGKTKRTGFSRVTR